MLIARYNRGYKFVYSLLFWLIAPGFLHGLRQKLLVKTMKTVSVGIHFVTSFIILARAINITDMNKLSKELLEGYNKKTLPINDMDNSVFEVKVRVILITLGDLDEVEERLSTVMGFKLDWRDESIVWIPWDHNDIENITMDAKEMWKPVFKVKNKHHGVVRPSDPDSDNDIYYNNTGHATWIKYTAFDTSCNVDMVFYPFDRQDCEVQLAISDYTAYKIRVIPEDTEHHLEAFDDNGAWTLMRHEVIGGNFSNMTMSYSLRRKPLFLLINVLLPIISLAFLTPLVFLVPMYSGERIGFAITTLLAISVYMTILSDNLPKNSDSMPIISVILLSWYIITSVTVLLVVINYAVYQTDDGIKIPKVFKKLVQLTRSCCKFHNVRKVLIPIKWRFKKNKSKEIEIITSGGENAMCLENPDPDRGERGEDKEEKATEITWIDVSDALDKVSMLAIYSSEFIITFIIIAIFFGEYKRD